MLTEVRMPKLGMSMKKGTVKRWLVAEGESVEKGAPLFELTTDKVNAVVEAPAGGVLGRLVAAPGTVLPVGAVLALIGKPGEEFPLAEAVAGGAVAAEPAPQAGARDGAAATRTEPGRAAGDVPASPAARRLARDLGIDIAAVPPSAPGKRITTEDVEEYAASSQPSPAATAAAVGKTVPFEGIRRVVAEHLSQSLLTMAQVTVSREAEVATLVNRREQLVLGFEVATDIRLTYTDLLIKEVATLLADHPRLNAYLDDETIVMPEAVHMGFAVALDDGLIVPVVREAHSKSLLEIARERTELAARAAAGTLALEEIEGGTFTISNLGAFGADSFTPIVNPPQCAILGVGRIVEKPVVVQGEVHVRPTMWLSLTFDHRLVDGAPAARFLQALADRLA
jgi:pyruvate dehydrogenase E2 component (dihydrolipoamide acetyltransferase)